MTTESQTAFSITYRVCIWRIFVVGQSLGGAVSVISSCSTARLPLLVVQRLKNAEARKMGDFIPTYTQQIFTGAILPPTDLTCMLPGSSTKTISSSRVLLFFGDATQIDQEVNPTIWTRLATHRSTQAVTSSSS